MSTPFDPTKPTHFTHDVRENPVILVPPLMFFRLFTGHMMPTWVAPTSALPSWGAAKNHFDIVSQHERIIYNMRAQNVPVSALSI